MDAIANDIPSSDPALQIQGFPTIVLIRGEDNAIVEYHGDRTVESFIEFLEENAANSITYDKAALVDEDAEEEEVKEKEQEQEQVVVKKDADEDEVEIVVEDEAENVAEDKAQSEPESEPEKEVDGHDEL
ncbi:protein disulfide-isomerase precursor [Coemansia sp. RSA 2703]|nr:protein disulfide-isomerase precursor [Coemansia sp. RSA 2703]